MIAENFTVIYIRVSTEEQARGGVSLEDQLHRAKAYCTSIGIQLDEEQVRVSRDEGISGSVPLGKRPKGEVLVRLVRSGHVKNVVAFKLDRLFRDAVDCLEVTREWDKLGVALHLLDLGGQAINTKSAMGRFMLTVVAGAAEMERNLIRERTRSAMQHKRERGDRLGATPLGYVTPEPGKPMQPVESELASVKLIIRLRRRDPRRWSYREIAARLENEGHKTKRGGSWAPQTVKRVWDRRAQYQAVV